MEMNPSPLLTIASVLICGNESRLDANSGMLCSDGEASNEEEGACNEVGNEV